MVMVDLVKDLLRVSNKVRSIERLASSSFLCISRLGVLSILGSLGLGLGLSLSLSIGFIASLSLTARIGLTASIDLSVSIGLGLSLSSCGSVGLSILVCGLRCIGLRPNISFSCGVGTVL